ncbi:MAG: carbohydrate kinase [Microcystis novacekii Mn_MB_F_20050700_S1]|uniref:Carbohydrate kinase n=1 Tax=Microcystis novacekii Mn_MB_F_20050700_S1D TaxID=2486266 RepID=A0A552JDB1_9CHRO|nr:MAG: carbohydrate kinase [Microcystis novacekii Mn_MB_F_20050700_S1]TRU93739.1 MAG: carbohydrate kinase [Microcystis novacekii Mn_MB_F_20050700_S1D]
MSLSLGIDFGTSGARAIAIDSSKDIVAEVNYPFTDANFQDWQKALFYLLDNLGDSVRSELKSIAINGTSSTVLLCDNSGNPLSEAILYNDGRGIAFLEAIKAMAPPHHPVISATSSLAKLLWWSQQEIFSQARYFLSQADWLAFLLHGKLGISDYHNALKLGYDLENLCYPDWLENLPMFNLLPEIFAPGTAIDTIKPDLVTRFAIPKDCVIYTGTTDSIAAFLASGANSLGEAVTSLGSTLVLKLLSSQKVDDSNYGIYSHRLGNLWLTGGASNTGGAVLKSFFSDQELRNYSLAIDGEEESNLDYYPLLKAGERFPINDPFLPAKLTPRPDNPLEFLHGLLESIARIEALGYQRLQELGANKLERVDSAGGGAKNSTWRIIRQRHLGVPVLLSKQEQAAYGTALLAQQSVTLLK